MNSPALNLHLMQEAERTRTQGYADRHLLDSRESAIRVNEIEFEIAELDNETIANLGTEYGMDLPELVARLKFFIEWADGQ